MQVRLYILHASCRQAHWVLSNISDKLVCQTNIMGTTSTLATFWNFVWPVHKMNKSSLAFTGKLNQEWFSASLTLNWSSAVYLKLTIGKRFNSAHDRIPISLLEQTSLRRSTESCGDTHKKRLFKIYKWTAESLNSMCDLTSAANLVNLLTDWGSPIYLCTFISDKLD